MQYWAGIFHFPDIIASVYDHVLRAISGVARHFGADFYNINVCLSDI